ncbi:hypothetical protein V6N13_110635 [Hibiscus sabdariffa]
MGTGSCCNSWRGASCCLVSMAGCHGGCRQNWYSRGMGVARRFGSCWAPGRVLTGLSSDGLENEAQS